MSAKSLILPLFLTAGIPAWHAQRHAAPVLPAGLPQAYFERPKISLNAASSNDVAALRGIGMLFAEEFVAARPARGFQSWDEVDALPGVGPARLTLIRSAFTLP